MASAESEGSARYDVASGGTINLGAVLAKAGEGTIHTIEGQPGSVAKIFHPTLNNLDLKLNKVAAMVASPPTGATQDDGFTLLTWPTHIVRRNHRPVGYVMPRIDTDNAVEIHALSNPSNRANPLDNSPQWPSRATWSHLVTVAANLCVAVDTVHHVDAVIGDFQERNILVADTCRVTLVDCDSMQFADSTGRAYICAVGRPEFSAPELLGQDLTTRVRGKESDLFALAVHIYLLLMAGNHPFQRGTWIGTGEQPGPMELAASGDWTGGRNSRLRTHPLAPPITFLPARIQQHFARAFTVGATDPSARSTAAEWHKALLDIEVVACRRGSHQVPIDTAACPWCAVDDERARRRKSTPPQRQTIHQIPAATQSSASAPKATASNPTAPGAPPRKDDAAHGSPAPSPTKNRPPFRSTTVNRPAKTAPPKFNEALGQSLYRSFLIIGIPMAILIVIMVVWIAVYILRQL